MLSYLLDALLVPANIKTDSPKELYELYFCFACIWAFGSAVFQDQAIDYRIEFSKWWVNEFKSVKFPQTAQGGTIFDFYIDSETKQFMPWTEKIPKFELDTDMPLQAVLVHTSESIRVRYFLDLLVTKRHPVMLVGAFKILLNYIIFSNSIHHSFMSDKSSNLMNDKFLDVRENNKLQIYK